MSQYFVALSSDQVSAKALSGSVSTTQGRSHWCLAPLHKCRVTSAPFPSVWL